jgi:protein arginine N-methyltransferase 3
MKVERGEPSRTEVKRSGKTGDAKLTLFSSSSSSFPWGIELNRIGLGADQDIDTNRVTVPELDFKSPFVLEPVSTSDSSPTKMRAFLTWFDTFFSPDASNEGQAPLERDTQYVKYEEDAYRRDVPVVSAKKTSEAEAGAEGNGNGNGDEDKGKKGGNGGKEVSFTTGPRGKATHWKQVAFMLKEPIEVPVGESRI